tara:strand:+ start:1481 stop:1585 length:105 start_codon:yes stop_codon:yes gene_type:complete
MAASLLKTFLQNYLYTTKTSSPQPDMNRIKLNPL